MPDISVINESTAISDADILRMSPAFDAQWNNDLRPIWGVEAAQFTFVPKGQAPAPSNWWVVFLDDSDQAGALAYHDLTDEGLPISKVFVKTLAASKSSISVGATHEICEMAVDPWLNSAYQDSQGVFWAGEICDPVEDDQYGYAIGGILVTDFVTPNWFGHQHAQSMIDHQGHAQTPFEVLSGGYAQKFDAQQGWVQVSGTQARLNARVAHAPEGSRRERRKRQVGNKLERSRPTSWRRQSRTLYGNGQLLVKVVNQPFAALALNAKPFALKDYQLELLSGAPQKRPSFNAAAPADHWLLAKPTAPKSGASPWDAAHAAASENGYNHYVEPDLVHERPVPPGKLDDGLNTHWPPTADDNASPAWHLLSGFTGFADVRQTATGTQVRIAHLDTGYTPAHISTPRNLRADLAYDFWDDKAGAVDPGTEFLGTTMPGHGTATLALLAGNTLDLTFGTQNYKGDFGGAPDAEIVPVRISPSVIHIETSTMAKGLLYALAPNGDPQNKCDVVSLSHGGLPSQSWADAVNTLYEDGVIIVAASGDSIPLGPITLATRYTVYPSAFNRVVTAVGGTFSKLPYITSESGVMQGCWGPDDVMEKAVAGYTPNVAWMKYNDTPAGFDMDGGGTSASTPQIAAACALWLQLHGPAVGGSVDWRRVEACRLALFKSADDNGKPDQAEMGYGMLDVPAMLGDGLAAQAIGEVNANPQAESAVDSVSSPFWQLLTGGNPPGGDQEAQMYETEVAQIIHQSTNPELVAAAQSCAAGKPADFDAGRYRAMLKAEPISDALRAKL